MGAAAAPRTNGTSMTHLRLPVYREDPGNRSGNGGELVGVRVQPHRPRGRHLGERKVPRRGEVVEPREVEDPGPAGLGDLLRPVLRARVDDHDLVEAALHALRKPGEGPLLVPDDHGEPEGVHGSRRAIGMQSLPRQGLPGSALPGKYMPSTRRVTTLSARVLDEERHSESF